MKECGYGFPVVVRCAPMKEQESEQSQKNNNPIEGGVHHTIGGSTVRIDAASHESSVQVSDGLPGFGHVAGPVIEIQAQVPTDLIPKASNVLSPNRFEPIELVHQYERQFRTTNGQRRPRYRGRPLHPDNHRARLRNASQIVWANRHQWMPNAGKILGRSLSRGRGRSTQRNKGRSTTTNLEEKHVSSIQGDDEQPGTPIYETGVVREGGAELDLNEKVGGNEIMGQNITTVEIENGELRKQMAE
ncbi:hypothetical protein FRX31_004279, partial [Thalictrum thalictroides]